MNNVVNRTGNVVFLKEHAREMSFPVINEVEAYWEGLRNGRAMPSRSEVDPRGLQRALSNAFIIERIAPRQARFRLAGHHLHDLMGMDVRGMPLSAVFEPETRDELGDLLAAMFDTPQVARMSLIAPRGVARPGLEASLILLPLLNEKGEVARALGALAFEGRIGRAPRRMVISHVRTRPLCPMDKPRQTVPSGMAEDAADFDFQSAAKRPDAKRPALRLVKNED